MTVAPTPSPDAYADEPFFTEADGLLLPGLLTGGPWNPDFQHGGPVSGILAHLVETPESPAPMRTVRHTVDMMRGVPLTPIRPEVEVLRSGRRIQVVRASLFAGPDVTADSGGVEVARATSLRMRIADDPNPVDPEKTFHPEDEPHPVPEKPVLLTMMGVGVPAFLQAVEFRQEGEHRDGAPGLVWLRMHNEMVGGRPTSAFAKLATVADMASMAAQYLQSDEWTTINADLTVTAFRDPVGDWMGVRGLHKNDGDGIGLSEAVLYDLDGRVGRATASILIEPR
ncbi:MAG: hypothetical protein CL466_06520 [Acidimicrobiaceae bacterium]|nr:hypothetical protein [Acidimicrobiaceae bacterium]